LIRARAFLGQSPTRNKSPAPLSKSGATGDDVQSQSITL
jgi:hypothetical protein